MITFDDVVQAIHLLKKGKSDVMGVSSEHLIHACPAIADSLVSFFTACLRHGFLPQCVSDCVLIPIPQRSEDASCSKNYWPIALVSTMSKVIEHIIILKYGNYFHSNQLQFGFKAGSSTTACTAIIKMVVSHYLNNDSTVLGCLLDASKAFDRVHHGLLFQKLLKRGLPSPIINFLLHWYCTQLMRVQWSPNCLSSCFSVTNGVRQGGVLSPFLFAVYLDGLLDELSTSGVGCYWRWMFAGAFCYADDIILLAPCAFALRTMLSICSSFASSHALVFNTDKTQLICFRTSFHILPDDVIQFNDVQLSFLDSVVHLGHLLSFDEDCWDICHDPWVSMNTHYTLFIAHFYCVCIIWFVLRTKNFEVIPGNVKCLASHKSSYAIIKDVIFFSILISGDVLLEVPIETPDTAIITLGINSSYPNTHHSKVLLGVTDQMYGNWFQIVLRAALLLLLISSCRAFVSFLYLVVSILCTRIRKFLYILQAPSESR